MNYNKNIFEELKKNRHKTPVQKELERLEREEQKLEKQAVEYHAAKWKETLEQKIPPRVYENLQKAFCMAFEVILKKERLSSKKHMPVSPLRKIFRCMISR